MRRWQETWMSAGDSATQRLQERSRFVREHGRWFYVEGELS